MASHRDHRGRHRDAARRAARRSCARLAYPRGRLHRRLRRFGALRAAHAAGEPPALGPGGSRAYRREPAARSHLGTCRRRAAPRARAQRVRRARIDRAGPARRRDAAEESGAGRRDVTADEALRQFRLDGAVAAITGGARGIGGATAELFAAVGARVAILDLDHEAAQALAQRIGPSATAHRLDVGSEREVDHVFETLVRDEGRIDILVNNAGIAIRRPTIELTLADWQRVVDINMTGVFLCARAVGRAMVAQRSGAIVTTASIMGLSGGGLYPNISYQATKGAIVNMTRALAVEWARQGIRVNAIAPTWVRTPLIRPITENPEVMKRIEEITPMGRIAEPEELVGAVLFLASRASAMVTGHVLAVDGGFLAQ